MTSKTGKLHSSTASRIATLCLPLALSGQASADNERNLVAESVATTSSYAIVDRVQITSQGSKGSDSDIRFSLVEIVPKSNPEYVCLGVINKGEVHDMDCFPRKTNPTPIMY